MNSGVRGSQSRFTVFVAAVATFLAFAPPTTAQEARVRVAVLNFDTYLIEQAEWPYPWAASGLGPLATSLLTSELASHRRFTVIERRYIDEILKEQDLGTSSRVNASTAAQLGQLLGAQVVVVGDVQEFGKKTVGGIGGLARRGLIGGRQEKLSIVLGARMIDAATGEILATSEGKADVSEGALGLLTASAGVIVGTELEGEASKVLREAIVDLAKNMVDRAEDFDIAPMIPCLTGSVATVAGGRVYLAMGASTSISVGDYFKIRDRQEAILDPATGDTLGFVEADKGFVRVAEVQERMSIADVVEGSGFARGQAAVRSAAPGDDTQCVHIRGAAPDPEPERAAPSAGAEPARALNAAVPPPAAAAPPPAAAAPPPAAREVADAGPRRARNALPSASEESPIGEWHLDGEETVQLWLRALMAASPFYRSLTEEEFREAMGGYLDPWRESIDAIAMRLSIVEDGTFHIGLRDPATMSLSTVDGTWRSEGILFVLSGTHIDGIEVNEVREEYIKLGGGRLFGQDVQMTQETAMLGMSAWQVRWPNLSGGAFVRTAQ